MRRTRLLGVILALLIGVTVASVALAAKGKQPARPQAKPAHAVQAKTTKARAAKARTHSASAASRATARTGGENPGEKTGADSDNVQQGDQVGSDESGPSGESESTPGDASVDHVEQSAGADHQCPPDCAPGENP